MELACNQNTLSIHICALHLYLLKCQNLSMAQKCELSRNLPESAPIIVLFLDMLCIITEGFALFVL